MQARRYPMVEVFHVHVSVASGEFLQLFALETKYKVMAGMGKINMCLSREEKKGASFRGGHPGDQPCT